MLNAYSVLKTTLLAAVFLAGCVTAEGANKEMPYERAIRSIAEAIEQLKPKYPQLAEFSAEKNCDTGRLKIDYGYRTHRPQRAGGWTAAVPNPDADGIWFYIDFHDPSSMAQIHTQPMVPDIRFRQKKVMFLILEGEKTNKVSGAINQILEQHGVRPPRP